MPVVRGQLEESPEAEGKVRYCLALKAERRVMTSQRHSRKWCRKSRRPRHIGCPSTSATMLQEKRTCGAARWNQVYTADPTALTLSAERGCVERGLVR